MKGKLRPFPFQEEIITTLKNKYINESDSHRAYLHMATGSGKTLTTVEFLRRFYLSGKKRILWVAHSWPLLDQAYETFVQQCGDELDSEWDCGYWASESGKKNYHLKQKLDSYRDRNWEGELPRIVFSTFKSMKGSLEDMRTSDAKTLAGFEPDIVVVDEAHYGKYGSDEEIAYDKLFEGAWDGIPILGLSATPKLRTKAGWTKELIASVSFKQLVESHYLARPEVVEIELETDVPVEFMRSGLIKNYSEIARDEKRNHEIASYYLSNRGALKKTMIFAIDIDHADLLGEKLRKHNVNAVVIHGNEENPYDKLDKFKHGAHDVAVLVRMGVEGIDIPDLNTVMLAKPVTSEIEFAQMIGRGSRITSTKKTFKVIDFYDSVQDERHHDHLYHFKKYYDGASSSTSNLISVTPRPIYTKSHSSGDGVTLYTLIAKDICSQSKSLEGLRINPSQSFGIELELSSSSVDISNKKEWLGIAKPLLGIVRDYFPQATAETPVYNYDEVSEIDYSIWNVVYDGSCGFEIVSPVMIGKEHLKNLYLFLEYLSSSPVLKELELEVDYSTGFHLHLGWDFDNVEKAKKLLHFMREYEPAINSLVSPSRVIGTDGASSEYCSSIRERFSSDEINAINSTKDLIKVFGDNREKYLSVNLSNFHPTGNRIEIRLHNGTLNPKKITLWIALWMNITHALDAFHADKILASTLKQSIGIPTKGDKGDIVELALSILHLDQNPIMIEKIHQRRCELISGKHWGKFLGDSAQRLIEDWHTLYSLYESSSSAEKLLRGLEE